MIYGLFIITLLHILEHIPYRNKFGLSLAALLKNWYYFNYGKNKYPAERCLCGGVVTTEGRAYEGWETACRDPLCNQIYGED